MRNALWGLIIWFEVAQATVLLAQTAEDHVARGMQQFRENNIAESIDEFDRAAEHNPESVPRLWQRGISYYYAGEFEKGRQQFLTHRAVNPHDVENAAWHFLCVARRNGLEAARHALIEIDTSRDIRVPMAQIYNFYAGKGSAAAVLQAADKADTPVARMYAHLYLGLHCEAAGDLRAARMHLLQAAGTAVDGHYMHDVARIHLLQRDWLPSRDNSDGVNSPRRR